MIFLLAISSFALYFDSKTLNNFFLINQMIIPGSSYWNFAFGGAPGDVHKDEEGMKTMQTLGENMAWVMKRLGIC